MMQESDSTSTPDAHPSAPGPEPHSATAPHEAQLPDRIMSEETDLRRRLNQVARRQLATLHGPRGGKSGSRKTRRRWFLPGLLMVGFAVLVWVIYSRLNPVSSIVGSAPPVSWQSEWLSQGARASGNNIPTQEGANSPLDPPLPTSSSQTPLRNMTSNNSKVYLPIMNMGYPACQDIREIQYVMIEGPIYTPLLGTVYENDPPPHADISWVLQNSGECTWQSFSLWSLQGGGDAKVNFTTGTLAADNASLSFLAPGQRITIIVSFPGDQASQLDAEWILQINNLFAFPAPHLVAVVQDWVQSRQSSTSSTPRSSGWQLHIQVPPQGTPISIYPGGSTPPDSRPTPAPPDTRP